MLINRLETFQKQLKDQERMLLYKTIKLIGSLVVAQK